MLFTKIESFYECEKGTAYKSVAPFYYAERSVAMNQIRAKPQRRTLHIIYIERIIQKERICK